MTLNEITTLIGSNLDKELDIPFRLQLSRRVIYWRARMMANHLQKNPDQRRHFLQTIYVPLVRGTAQSNVYSDSHKSETICKLPDVIKIGTAKYDYLGGVDGQTPYYPLIVGTGAYMEESRFYHQFVHYDEINQFITTDKPFLDKIRVAALFADPTEAFEICCVACPNGCDTWNMEFPISAEMLQLVVQSILQIDYNRKDTPNNTEIELTPKQ